MWVGLYILPYRDPQVRADFFMGNLYTQIHNTHRFDNRIHILHELKVAWKNKDYKLIKTLQSKLDVVNTPKKNNIKERPTSFSWVSRGVHPDATIKK